MKFVCMFVYVCMCVCVYVFVCVHENVRLHKTLNTLKSDLRVRMSTNKQVTRYVQCTHSAMQTLKYQLSQITVT